MSDLDDLDAEQRELRRERMQRATRNRASDIARAKRILIDPQGTAQEKRDAKILIGAYAIDPVLMAASGDNRRHYGDVDEMSGYHNHHSVVPPPPASRVPLLERLRKFLLNRRAPRRSD
jgi:hypothetical protein